MPNGLPEDAVSPRSRSGSPQRPRIWLPPALPRAAWSDPHPRAEDWMVTYRGSLRMSKRYVLASGSWELTKGAAFIIGTKSTAGTAVLGLQEKGGDNGIARQEEVHRPEASVMSREETVGHCLGGGGGGGLLRSSL
ncbi:hypothetical protein NDU88_001439 [Pleurodeles waltl]|uniref:Uncharacterized protein n=1 Tax=Pleurodeles waltl TaxID=8319 RepID=A0AAV7NDE9_PLEWA|nr:hypothetical protein NDU88_001439 [Pleurodeles waltl]